MSALTTHPLTDKQRAFAAAYAFDDEAAGNGKASAIKAGYAEKYAAQEAYRMLRNEGVRGEINRLGREMLGDLASASIRLLGRVVKDESESTRLRIDAAKAILDRAGYIAPKAAEPDRPVNSKPMAQWTAAELEEFLERTRAKIAHAEQRTLIDVTPAPPGRELATDRDPGATDDGPVEDTARAGEAPIGEGRGGPEERSAAGNPPADGGASREAGNAQGAADPVSERTDQGAG
jgi:phage terminase small subunit